MDWRTTHGLSKTPEYKAWVDMRQRCFNPNNDRYFRYGARGITICERWQIFENFLADMGLRPTPDHSLDRHPNNDGNYEPTNCRWATRSEQQNNKGEYPAENSLPKGDAHWTRMHPDRAQRIARANIIKAHKRGSENGNSRLTEDKVKTVKSLIALGDSDVSIAERFDVRPGTIWFIRTGKHWTHV